MSTVLMATEQMVSFQIAIFSRSNIQVNHEAGKDEPEQDVGGEDVSLVVVVQAFCRACLTKVCGQRGDHEGGPA